MNEKIKSVLEYTITKVRENQVVDCDGNKYTADTNEAYIRGKLERYMIAHDINVKGITVEFLYDLVGRFYGKFEPIRRMAVGTSEEGNECAIRIWCLYSCRNKTFQAIAEAVGRLYIKDEDFKLPRVRARLRSMGVEASLADTKFILGIMEAIGILQRNKDGDLVAVERTPIDEAQRALIDKTYKAIRTDLEDVEPENVVLIMFPFFHKDVLREIFAGEGVCNEATTSHRI